MSDGFLLVDKPAGWTSHDVVARVRRLLPGRIKVGHAGTLDPMATGLLVVGLGRATRLLRFVQDLAKHYRAVAVFGVATDTLDADGTIVEERPMPLTAGLVREALPRLTGPIEQVPPMVSALKVGGQRLYELARKGEEVARKARPVTIYRFELEDLVDGDHPQATFDVECSKGTYVRTLIDDLAIRLGGRAHLTALRRLRIGSLSVDAAHTIEVLAEAAAAGSLDRLVLSPGNGLCDLPELRIDAAGADRVVHGARLSAAEVAGGGADGDRPFFRVTNPRGDLLAVYRLHDQVGIPEVVVG